MIKELGYEPYPDDKSFPETQLLTVYAYPNELDWDQIRKLGWFNLEVFNKECINELDLKQFIPSLFVDDTFDNKWSGKWI